VKLLAIYLNDHLTGATAGRELAKRALGSNSGNRFGETLEWIAPEIDEDRETLLEIMRTLEIGQDRVKKAAGFLAERTGRLKLNGSLTSYSPLSRLVEFEGLTLGVAAKQSLWRTLGALDDPRLGAFDFAALEQRAGRHHEALEADRLEAARIALPG